MRQHSECSLPKITVLLRTLALAIGGFGRFPEIVALFHSVDWVPWPAGGLDQLESYRPCQAGQTGAPVHTFIRTSRPGDAERVAQTLQWPSRRSTGPRTPERTILSPSTFTATVGAPKPCESSSFLTARLPAHHHRRRYKFSCQLTG